MNTQSFDRILIRSAFTCMASDGHIDQRELDLIRNMCFKSSLFQNFNFEEEINSLVSEITVKNKTFISEYFQLLDSVNLSEAEELMLIDFALKVIQADGQVEYSEIKFFKNIRYRLKISDEKILTEYPDYEVFLIEDIVTDSLLDKIASDYLNSVKLPDFIQSDFNFENNKSEED